MGTTTKLITYEDSLTMSENRFEEISLTTANIRFSAKGPAWALSEFR